MVVVSEKGMLYAEGVGESALHVIVTRRDRLTPESVAPSTRGEGASELSRAAAYCIHL